MPKDFTLDRATVDSRVSMVYNVPSYLMAALEIRLIRLPKYGIAPD